MRCRHLYPTIQDRSPSAEEIGKIQRRKYTACSEMMADLAQNIVYGEKELQQIIRQQFVQFWQEEAVQEIPLNRLLNKAVYLLCWLKRYGTGMSTSS